MKSIPVLMVIFWHKNRDSDSSSKSLKSLTKVSKKYQHTFKILFFIFLLKRFTVDKLIFIASAHCSSEISLQRILNNCSSESVKLHSLMQYSISGFVKLHTFKNAHLLLLPFGCSATVAALFSSAFRCFRLCHRL